MVGSKYKNETAYVTMCNKEIRKKHLAKETLIFNAEISAEDLTVDIIFRNQNKNIS